MTDLAEIAKKLTPAQVKALRDPDTALPSVLLGLIDFEHDQLGGVELFTVETTPFSVTPLGRAVLAALDAKEST